MLRFHPGRNYSFVFIAYIVLVAVTIGIAAYSGHDRIASNVVFTSMPILMAFLVVFELWSGVALDSWWVAKYPCGGYEFKLLVAWHMFGTICLAMLAVLAWG